MCIIVGAILIVGILVTVILCLICYQDNQFYVSKQYILKEVQSGKKTKIVGNTFDIRYNDQVANVYKGENDVWTYTLNDGPEDSKEVMKLREGKYIVIQDIKFEIVTKKKLRLIILLPIGVVVLSSMLLLSQGILMSGLDKGEVKKDETTELNKNYIKEDGDKGSTETISKNDDIKLEINNQEDAIIPEEQYLEDNNEIVDMHTTVSNNDYLFQNNRIIDWEYEKNLDNMRWFLKNMPSEVGINVSYYQKTIDWEKVKADGIDFAIIHIGSRGYETAEIKMDPKFEENMDGAISNGIKTGVYFYSQAINQKEMDEEIDVILKAVEGYSLEYPIGIELDCEENYRTYELFTEEYLEEYIDLIKYFCIKIEQHGYTPMIFGHLEWFQQFPEDTFNGYYKWIYSPDSPPDGIDNCIIWQYRMNTKGKVDGIDDQLVLSMNMGVFDKK